MGSIWEKVKQHQGETFETVNGKPFTYTVEGNKIIHTRCKTPIFKSNFEKAVCLNPQKPSDLQMKVTGPSYVYAIISDPRLG